MMMKYLIEMFGIVLKEPPATKSSALSIETRKFFISFIRFKEKRIENLTKLDCSKRSV